MITQVNLLFVKAHREENQVTIYRSQAALQVTRGMQNSTMYYTGMTSEVSQVGSLLKGTPS